MPLTPNGKLDRRALPAPSAAPPLNADTQREFVAPRDPLEQQIADIWRNVLGIARVGAYDNFFALGGHSLLATQVLSQMRAQLNRDVPLKSLFEAPELATFAHLSSQAEVDVITPPDLSIQPAVRDARLSSQFPLSFAQQRLWFLDQLEPGNAFYNMPTIIRLAGQLDVVALEKSVTYLIERHESLRTTIDTDENGEPVQVIHPPSFFTLLVTVVEHEEMAEQLAQEETTRPFNLSAESLVRVRLLKISETDHRLLLTMHHIIGDGQSLAILVEELTHAYRAYTCRVSDPPDLNCRFSMQTLPSGNETISAGRVSSSS